MAHSTHHNSTSEQIGEQIAWEERQGSNGEAARELNYVRAHSDAKTFNAVYKSANSYIDKYNQHDGTRLPKLQLVDTAGATANNVKDATGIKIGDTTYATSGVKNQTQVNDQDGITVGTGGHDAKFGDYNKRIVDNQGNTTLLKANGDYQTTDGHGNVVTLDQNANHKHIDYANGDQLDVTKSGNDTIIKRSTADGKNESGKAAENYTATVHHDGTYEMTYKDADGVEQHHKATDGVTYGLTGEKLTSGDNYRKDQVKNNRFDEDLNSNMNPEYHGSSVGQTSFNY